MGVIKMLTLLLAISLLQQSASFTVTPNVSGSLNEEGTCVCSIILPDTTFPVDRMEILEITSQNLNVTFQQEIIKIQQYSQTLSVYTEKLKSLTHRVEVIESGGESYTELDFELLKLEIREMESLVLQLKLSFNESNAVIERLYSEVQNISVTVTQLETFDKNNVLAIRREITALKKRLQDCENNQNTTVTPAPPVIYGNCDHGGLLNISKPFVVQLNWRGFSYKYGGWGKDPSPISTKKDLYWIAPLNTDGRLLETYRTHTSYDDLLLYKTPTDKQLSVYNPNYNSWDYSKCAQGSGMVLYNNFLYYNCYNSRDMCRVNVDTNAVERKTLSNAVFNNRFSYAGVNWQDMDFAVDENGLWIIYATEESTGNIVISKLNATSMTVEKTWFTTQYKPAVTNAFIICGVLYATRPVNTRKEEIFYTFDTKTGQEGKISIMLDKMMEIVQSLSYNPEEHKLYMYNDGYQVTYDLIFKPNVKLP